MPTSFDADFRLFVHNPPSESNPGGPAVRYQRGSARSGSQEWRTNDRESARRKARRIVTGHDVDNQLQSGGWVSLQVNDIERWSSVEIFTQENV